MCGNDASAASDEAIAAVFKAIRLQGWSGLPLPRELHVGVYAFVNPVWCLKPPLPSPLSGAVLQHHTELVIDCSNTRQRTFWETMTPQTAYELGKQMINLRCLIRRYPRTPEGAPGVRSGYYVGAYGWCHGIFVALVEGHVAGRRLAREKEWPTTTSVEGSLQSFVFEAVVLSNSGRPEMTQLNNINITPPTATPSQAISLPALTHVKGIHLGLSAIDGRGWAMPALQRVFSVSTDMAHIRAFIATTQSLVQLEMPQNMEMMPLQLAELLQSIPAGQQGSPGPLANLRVILRIKVYEIESTDMIRDGFRDLQKCLVDRGCSKCITYLDLSMRRSDCHSLILNDSATFKALATFINTTCAASGKVCCRFLRCADEVRDIPLNNLVSYTRFDKVPGCGPQLLSILQKL
ncbi:unnamed protein product [Vitrella brassicaformis CCMP3155]|uniref:Uncharacterized protein n=2 Tax=Vitrella brassicaformis TaxID=1169539 RepID=A0A0G4EWT7_VITBC|nr:unnamed protein product [Vitrella brassicaformis CCMP3155]|eukprot:CEM03447.1 unnamed protein product [Vitrella brassicaformis CCMP3155]